MDAVADYKDTMMQLLHNLQQQFIVGKRMRWLVLEGDAKLHEVVKSLKFEYIQTQLNSSPYMEKNSAGLFHILGIGTCLCL